MNEKSGVRPSLPWWVVALLLVAAISLAGLAAIGARDVPGTGTSREIAVNLGWDPLAILSWLVLGVFGFVAYMMLSSPRGPMEAKGGGKRRTSSMAVFIVLAVLAAVALFVASPGEPAGMGRQVGLPGEGSLAETLPAQPAGSLIGLILFVAVIAATTVGFFYIDRRRVIGMGEPETSTVLASVDAAIHELEMGGEPRKTVIAAYRNMEAALARVGVARDRHEAPLEYVTRSLAVLHVHEGAISRLASLFEEARFSTHSIDDHMAEAAMSALSEIRSDLERI